MSVGEQSRPRTVAIVQARMGSTRLPGKVLKPIAGKPLLWHVVHRLRRCRTLDAIVLATSTNPRDDAIETFGREEGIAVVRGPEDNVLGRFALAANETRADVIVRVSADAPLLDPGFIDHMVRGLIAEDGDYVLLEEGAVCAHEGVDPFSRRALDKLMREVPDDPVAREHVTGYFKLHPEFVRIVHVPALPDLAHDAPRLTVDTPDDIAFIETLHERMQAKAGEASLSDLLLLLEREPRLKSINAHVRQKQIQAQGAFALILCDGGGTFGFGHVKRSLTLARALRDREGVGAVFALNGEEEAAGAIRQAGFEVCLLPQLGKASVLAGLVAEKKPDMLIVDVREGLTREVLERLAARTEITAVIDDGTERRYAATHAYYPPVPQAEALSWEDTRTVVRIGWEWALLGFDPARVVPCPRVQNGRPTLVVSMGGSDPLDLTHIAMRALMKIGAPFDARFIIGPGFRNAPALSREIEASSPNFRTVQGLNDLGLEFAAADFALVAFGVTAYELAALGVPALYLALSDDHALSASRFEQAGMGALIGLGRALRAEEIARAVWRMIENSEKRRDMRAVALNAVDGRAGERIAADLVEALTAARRKGRAAASS